jgi:hypothetical protein
LDGTPVAIVDGGLLEESRLALDRRAIPAGSVSSTVPRRSGAYIPAVRPAAGRNVLGATRLPGGVESPFETLRVDPDADAEEIEQAYRERVIEAHPDHGGSAAEFQAVRVAYEAIRDGDHDRDRAPMADGSP